MLLVRRDNDNWLSNMFDDLMDNSWMPRMHATEPAVNVKENSEEYMMEIAAPGLKKEFCRISLDADGNLMVKMEDKFEHQQENKKEHYLRREFNYTNFEQTYSLPDDVDRSKIAAKVSDGILHIDLPKIAKEEVKVNRNIEVA